MKNTLLAVATLSLLTVSTFAGTFREITIDGSFDDWLGVPVLETADANAEGSFDFKDIAMANDDAFLYIRVRLHRPVAYASFHHDLAFDTDADGTTGTSLWGVGSEMLVEDGNSYQQKNGAFNEGGGSNLNWRAAPAGVADAFEMRVSRGVLDTEQLPFFQGDDIVVSYIAQTLEWQLSDAIQGVPYTFTTQPERFQGSKVLADFEETLWFYQEVADPVAPDWRLADYTGEVVQGLDETWKVDQGLFVQGFANDAFPVATQVALNPGRTTYYFRTSFLWEHAGEGVAFQAEAYLSDGAVIYLNGEEIRRIRMPEGIIEPGTAALGLTQSLGEVESFSLPARSLLVGENILTVEVHRVPRGMEAIAFGLQLSVNDSVPPSLEDNAKPEDREVIEGESTVFALGAIAGTAPFDYQWYKNGEMIPNADGAQLEIPEVLEGDAGIYEAEVRNASGTVRSRAAVLTTTAAPPVFTENALPADQTVLLGRPFTLTAAIGGSPPFTYQWTLNGEVIPGATGALYMVDAASAADAGDYQLTVSNRASALESRIATVLVEGDTEAPLITRITGGSQTVTVVFSERVSNVQASQFLIAGDPAVEVSLSEEGRTVTLHTADALTFGQTYALDVSGVEDPFGNALTDSQDFQATILIDGDFSDWHGIDPIATDAQSGDGLEFHQYWVANDDEYLYVRFSFHSVVGPLPGSHFYHLFIDGDNDPNTGLNGSSLMIENGLGWLQIGGGFNEGSVPSTGFVLAPETASTEFECRVSLAAVSQDGVPLVTADAVGLRFELIDTSWAVIDSGPDGDPIVHALDVSRDPGLPVTPRPFVIDLLGTQIELQWESGVLESSETLRPGSWVPVPGATSPHIVLPNESTQFYRARD